MTALTLMDPAGEIVEAIDAYAVLHAAGIPDIRDATAAELAPTMERLRELRGIVAEAEGLGSDRLVALLDANAKWTLHEGEYTIKSASPEAGCTSYDVDRLRHALADLVVAEVISADGANAAVETVQPTVAVPYALLRAVALALDGEAGQFEHEMSAQWVENLLADEPEPTYKLKPAGVKNLLKLPQAREAIEACAVVSEPGRRRAKVTRS